MKHPNKEQVTPWLLGFSVPMDLDVARGIPSFPRISIAEVLIFCIAIFWLFQNEFRFNRRALLSGAFFLLYAIWTLTAALLLKDVELLKIVRDVFSGVLVFITASSLVSTESKFHKVKSGFLAAVFLNSLLGLSQLLLDWPRFISPDEHGANLKENFLGETTSFNAVTGIFPHPNAFALFLVVAIILFLPTLRLPRLTFKGGSIQLLGFGSTIGIALLIGNLYFTFGKGAILWLALGIASIFASPFFNSRTRPTISLLLLSIVLVSIVVFLLPHLADTGRGGTLSTRIDLWKASKDAVLSDDYSLLLGGSQDMVRAYGSLYTNFEYSNAHNTYFNQFVYFGLFGGLLYALNSIATLRALSKFGSFDKLFLTRTSLWSAHIAILGILFFEPFHAGVSNLALLGLWSAFAFGRLASAKA